MDGLHKAAIEQIYSAEGYTAQRVQETAHLYQDAVDREGFLLNLQANRDGR